MARINTHQKLKGWLKSVSRVFADTWTCIQDAQIPLVASSLAYTTILSVIPLLAVSFALFKAFGGLDKLQAVIQPMIVEYLAESASQDAIRSINQFIAKVHAGAVGATGLVGLVITTMTMLQSAERAINQVWQAPITRPLFYRISAYWLFVTLGPIAAAFAIGATSSKQLHFLGFLPKWIPGYFLTMGFFFLIYKFVPNRRVYSIPALAAAFATSTLWGIARLGYGLYTRKVVGYDAIYGSLGAIPIILVWIYISWVIVLAGAALSAAMQKRLDLR